VELELRHLRYFVAVAETRSLTVAAKKTLHTTQPSLSRQIRDLEEEVGAQLLTRSARGIELTPAGHAFLEHARSVLLKVDAAADAARRVAILCPEKVTTTEQNQREKLQRFHGFAPWRSLLSPLGGMRKRAQQAMLGCEGL
jgi:Bacterial regulatory helix-turn-helix protein, lysR family